MTGEQLEGVEVRRLTGTVGAELSGVDLNQPIDSDTAALICSTLYENCALVIPGQFPTPDSHVRLAQLFGDPFLPDYYSANALEGYPDIAVVPNFGKARAPAEGWHTDWSHFSVPPTVSVAVGAVIPPTGGDTMFSNQYVAYERLSDGMKEFLAGRLVRFCGMRPVGAVRRMHGTSDLLPKGEKEEVVNLHPIARVHEHTGRTALYLNRPGAAMTEFEGMTADESGPLLQFLYEQSVNPDNVYRHQWSPGDVVIWDNRCAMHYGVHDYGDVERTLNRITVGGTP